MSSTKLKSHKSILDIAKKHGVDVSAIEKELTMGIKVEGEHTKSKAMAKIIALQHLEEIPNYYTKLKKMEKKTSNKKVNEDVTILDCDGNPFFEFIDLVKPDPIYKKKVAKEEKDHEHSMARSELKTAQDAIKRLQKKLKGEGNIEAWVQSKITRASEYLDTAADYIDSGESKVEEDWKMPEKIDPKDIRKSRRSTAIRTLSQAGSTEGERNAAATKRNEPKMPLVRKGDTAIRNINAGYEPSLVNKILDELKEDGPCWKGYSRKKGTKKYEKGSCVKSEQVEKTQEIEEARIPAQNGNIILVMLTWRGKTYTVRMFFPQVTLPNRNDITDEIQKIYPDARVLSYKISDLPPGQLLIQVQSPGNKNYVKPMGMVGEEVEIIESKKSEMKCNKPKAEAHGSGETGKSHVVKACENGKEKLIRFGQLGVKGSPKKKGESDEYASRRHRFKTRHAKNIAKGKMSAAWWANKVKW